MFHSNLNNYVFSSHGSGKANARGLNTNHGPRQMLNSWEDVRQERFDQAGTTV